MITRQWLLSVVKRYNGNYRRFTGKHAEHKFLHRIGLGIDNFPPGFEQSEERIKWENEKALFEALHFVRYRLKKAMPPILTIINRAPSKEQLRLARTFKAIRNRIASANLRLVGRCIGNASIQVDVDEMRCVGRVALLNAAECFDPWRGWRFSTYACHAIIRRFYRLLPKRNRIEIIGGADPGDVITSDERDPNHEYLLERLRKILRRGSQYLTEVEVEVISKRYGIPLGGFNTLPMTLSDVAKHRRVSKERIRQIQMTAIEKLQIALDNEISV